MPDMLVKLYAIPELAPTLAPLETQGIVIRPPRSPEKPRVLAWVDAHFAGWTREVASTFSRVPVSSFVALRGQDILGFSCYDSICPNFFGPTGVLEKEQRRGIGKALLLAALHAQKAQGYAYAIIGGVGPAEYYAKTVGATLIDGSTPGIYDGLLF
jgi:predicted N-acetyltransferase YhbS